jgi:predicted tellurium resistance membrane protein TerC
VLENLLTFFGRGLHRGRARCQIIPLVIFGSALLTSLLDRLPILVYAGVGLLVYIAVEMFFEDTALHD